jgi:hypothetical protein
MSHAHRRRVLAIIATDSTFERAEHRGGGAWIGKCLHCNAHLVVGLDGEPVSRATIEHILPPDGRWHGRAGEPRPRVRELVERLLTRRRERWRDPG